MNSSEIKFPTPRNLSLRRPAPENVPSIEDRQAAVAKAQCRLLADMEEFREREVNLRAYEARLRAMQAKFEAQGDPHALKIPTPQDSPLATIPGVDEAWRKLHRARELLELEQRHIQTERLELTQIRGNLEQREALVAKREADLENLERHLVGKLEKPKQGRLSFTRIPFGLGKTALTKS